MTDAPLFETMSSVLREPLAARMRPRTLDEYIGQDHIVGKGRLLRRAIAADQLSSVIFYGPPGSGKTTLARVIANHTKSNFITLNAVLTGVADIRSAIKQAEEYFNLYSRRTILFVDEVHRWNRAQQDALLPWVENGTIILIGATTENPFFEVNKALVSRSRVFQLKALTNDDLQKAAEQALSDTERGYGHWNVTFEKGALEHLVETANGDARSLLNALELAVETTPEKWDPGAEPPVPAWGTTIYISAETAEESIQKKVVLYDRDGDYHYDIISAFIKSLRGRDADAAMYWLARMIAAGEDAHFIFRRMLISACEDTGLADPHAITVVASCAAAFDRVGMPEGRYFLAHAALYLATAPKSNSSMAFFDALASVEKEDADVPNHLRDPSRDAEGFGHGEGYLYPHAYRAHWVAQQYLPDALVGSVFYTPSTQGYEKSIRDDVLSRRELHIAALLEREQMAGRAEQLTLSPVDFGKEHAFDRAERAWQNRLDSNRADVLLTIRDEIITRAALARHHRSLVWNADDGLLLWEVMRRTPEGMTACTCKTEAGKQILEQYARTLADIDRPYFIASAEPTAAQEQLGDIATLLLRAPADACIFDRIFFRDVISSRSSIDALVTALVTTTSVETNSAESTALADGGAIILSQRIPAHGQRLSALISEYAPHTSRSIRAALPKMIEAEDAFYGDTENELFNWDVQTIIHAFENAGYQVTADITTVTEQRRITVDDSERWFRETSMYGRALRRTLLEPEIDALIKTLHAITADTPVSWQSEIAYLVVTRT
ncbi:MAG: AAA family ATPase [Treponema sp.]|nr:AAA family ATPase [Treponema sp.]